MKYLVLIFVTSLMSLGLCAQKKMSYALYNAKGKKISYKKMSKDLAQSDVILFGEEHDNAISHWMQLEMCKKLGGSENLILGAEMLEADQQKWVDLYLKGALDYVALDSSTNLWPNFKTDYLPLLDFARKYDLSFVASNVPRRYARMVYGEGLESLDSLTEMEKTWMAPLPLQYDSTVACYRNIFKMAHGHGNDRLPKAQALKDATMAHRILTFREAGELFLHFNGAYHSDNYGGILWWLKKWEPGLSYRTISTVTQKETGKLESEYLGRADFILVVDEDVTRTF